MKNRLRRWTIRHLVLPLLNRELAKQGIHLYRYIAATDRLLPYKALTPSSLRGTGEIPSDLWYRALQSRALRGAVAFDVGVNYGYTSVWLSQWADRVYVFEPNPENRAMIREQLQVRRTHNVEIAATAISDHEGSALLHVKPFDGHHSLADIGASTTVRTLEVPVTTLDRFALAQNIQRISLLKIDVEGFEPEVLRGASGLLSQGAIDLILFEYSPQFYQQRGIDPLAPLAVLDEYGYRTLTIDGKPLDRSSLSKTQQIDFLAEPRAVRRQ